ncbi:hypothetical protein BST81_06195 [Leptolyngbya sp. 'hensonii']|nr:hypothetical protein BST81_06195 [Leptolyngbya sp. 'hensonii']
MSRALLGKAMAAQIRDGSRIVRGISHSGHTHFMVAGDTPLQPKIFCGALPLLDGSALDGYGFSTTHFVENF